MTSAIRRYVLKTFIGLLAFALFSFATDARAQILLHDDFVRFSAPPGNFNGGQFQSGRPVAFSGDLPDWSKTGAGTVHAVNNADIQGGDIAVMFWQDNVITQESAIGGSNNSGETYTVDFLASPAVYNAGGQATAAGDGLLIELLRSDDSVLDSYVNMPGAWAGNLNLIPDSFQYVGDGSGDLRVRVGPSNPNQGRFTGALDDFTVTGAGGEVFADDFNDVNSENFNALQFDSGLPVAFGGNLPGWAKAGAGVVHVVERTPPPAVPADFAVMIWQDNVLTLNTPVAGSNEAGQSYLVEFDASPAVYQAPNQVTTLADGLLVEVLRSDDTVLASLVHEPGDWAGDIALLPVSFPYVGDGSGDIRVRIGPSNFNSGRFGGAIDNLSVIRVPEPSSLALISLAIAGLGLIGRKRNRA